MHGWRAYDQGRRWVWILSGPWVDETSSRTLVSSTGTVTSVPQCLQTASLFSRYANSCGSFWVPGKAPNRSLGGWDWLRITAEWGWNWVTGLLQGPQLGPKIIGLPQGHRQAYLPLGPWADRTIPRPWLQAAGARLQDCFKDHNWTKVNGSTSKGTGRHGSQLAPG